MSASGITRRTFAGGAAFLALAATARAQGFAGLEEKADGFALVVPGRAFSFPADHGPHPEFRIEWWYVTANLRDAAGTAYGAQWTLFRQALRPGPLLEGWATQQVWMAHAAVTGVDAHHTAETFARGGVGQANVEAAPFRAFIDAWQMRALDGFDTDRIAPLELTASSSDFSYALRLTADRPLVLQGDGGFSKKSEREQASYYYSQPFFKVTGEVAVDGKPVTVTGLAWMDREWSSQPLASDQSGWDWFALHLDGGEKLMLYRMRHADDRHYASGNFISPEGKATSLATAEIAMTPKGTTEIAGRRIPTAWHVAIPRLNLAIDCTPLNPKSWMGTAFAYWEGPISFAGSHRGVGYLELTGY
ncbi:lipocalin-like domain-containing protein [Bradyrhizobium sp.]|uniref:lipocalin-like domain-containing protein n=1 Tax=Bradyrhizobium sp. TaxID=376 RepID=UPI0040379B3C